MDKNTFQKYLKDRYYAQIDWYDRKSTANQSAYKKLQFSLIALSSLTPVFILIDKLEITKGMPWLFWLPATTSILVAILASTIKAFRFQENWINYRTTCETLRKEIYLYQAKVGEYKSISARDELFVERSESLISRENTLWLAAQKPEREQKAAKE